MDRGAGEEARPLVPPVHDVGLGPGGKPYFTMKLVKGESLQEVIDKVADEKRRAAADARVAKVMSTLAEKRYQEANDALNGAFELLR